MRRPTAQPDTQLYGNLLEVEESPVEPGQYVVRIRVAPPRAVVDAKQQGGMSKPVVEKGVTGEVTVKLYKGAASVIARSSPYSLYSVDLVTFEEGSVAYDHHDAEGFIRLNALRLRTYAARGRRDRGS